MLRAAFVDPGALRRKRFEHSPGAQSNAAPPSSQQRQSERLSSVRIKLLGKRLLVNAFHFGQRLGFDLLPRHFYSEVPDIRQLRSTDAWRRPYSMTGVGGADVEQQLEFVRGAVTSDLRDHFASCDVHAEANRANGAEGYGKIEAQMLFAFVATHRPQRILQVGCGVSTALCLAGGDFSGYAPEITCIEPYPTRFLQAAADSGKLRLYQEKVENMSLDTLDLLQAGDLLFIDSTHTLGPAGEVTRIILEMLPRLRKGVYVHFHDIVFPYDYSPWILEKTLFFWHESPLLHAFLCMNPAYRIRASLSMLHHERLEAMTTTFVDYRPMNMTDGTGGSGDFPSSIYLEAVGATAANPDPEEPSGR